ncbi:ABC transporter permease [Aminobacterium sp. EBM-42]|jgi:peptide/nickel transport system permease protein|uniref:Binding-protein-dependent transport systems inner membrane component n=2 Tax=Aminobacterium TaxID=81466 RepID=D5EGU4_AMICL|nr:ABC transporter permease [Aminobacterium sp. EBM-42]ADE57776.1 binding-protein-dependent transport systems inner membrane component [Aminobacterium colombiense DSM 12261]MDD2379453.1 ABC transporter permease [Aminobacterium colombiense]MDD4586665.1 ABC transporter permease [Aminobacterium colombiense]
MSSSKSNSMKNNTMWRYTFIRLRRNYLAMIGLAVLLVLIFMAIFAEQIAPYGYADQDYMMIRKPPSAEHFLGTDEFGRDVFSRLIYGSRISLQVGLIAVSISLIAGGAIGAIAGYFGGRIDNILMRIMDVQLAIPTILLAIVISSALGPGLFNLMVAVGITSIPRFARLMRASVLSIKGMEYIEAARAMGASHFRIIMMYILPNCMAPLIVQSTLSVANAILFAATLSFLGLGIQPPYPEWGGMLSTARPYLRNSAYLSIFPGLAIMITIVALNCIGDGLRDALDPKQKR